MTEFVHPDLQQVSTSLDHVTFCGTVAAGRGARELDLALRNLIEPGARRHPRSSHR